MQKQTLLCFIDTKEFTRCVGVVLGYRRTLGIVLTHDHFGNAIRPENGFLRDLEVDLLLLSQIRYSKQRGGGTPYRHGNAPETGGERQAVGISRPFDTQARAEDRSY